MIICISFHFLSFFPVFSLDDKILKHSLLKFDTESFDQNSSFLKRICEKIEALKTSDKRNKVSYYFILIYLFILLMIKVSFKLTNLEFGFLNCLKKHTCQVFWFCQICFLYLLLFFFMCYLLCFGQKVKSSGFSYLYLLRWIIQNHFKY